LKTKFLPKNNKDVLIFLLINTILYICVLLVRTQQAYIFFGNKIDVYPITRFLRSFNFGMSGDQLRWASYFLLFLISIIYLLVAAGAFHLGKIADQNQEKKRFLVWAIIPYIVLGFITILLYPHVSVPLDTVDYTVHARIQTIHSENPYEVPGVAYSMEEPLTNYQEAKSRPSVYGPVWQYISLLPAAIGNGNLVGSIVAFKMLFLGVGFLALGLVWSFHTSPNIHSYNQLLPSAVLVAWSPLIHLVSHGDGHNDILMAIFLAAMIVALNFQKPFLGFINYGFSFLVKFISAPILFPLIVYVFRSGDQRTRLANVRLILLGMISIVLITLAAIAPFGVFAILAGISGRYGSLVSSSGTSKISLIAGMVYEITSRIGINISSTSLTSLVGLTLPLSWLAFVFIRSLSVRTINDVVKIVLESYLFYVTFVALPAHVQYIIPFVIISGFLYSGNWHRVAVILISLAFLWDLFFLIYSTPTPLALENYMHPISHLLVITVPLFYFGNRYLTTLREVFCKYRMPL